MVNKTKKLSALVELTGSFAGHMSTRKLKICFHVVASPVREKFNSHRLVREALQAAGASGSYTGKGDRCWSSVLIKMREYVTQAPGEEGHGNRKVYLEVLT